MTEEKGTVLEPMREAREAKLLAIINGPWSASMKLDQLREALAAQQRAETPPEPNPWADCWYFVMDEAPMEFERIVTTYAPVRWHEEAHKLMRAKYPTGSKP